MGWLKKLFGKKDETAQPAGEEGSTAPQEPEQGTEEGTTGEEQS